MEGALTETLFLVIDRDRPFGRFHARPVRGLGTARLALALGACDQAGNGRTESAAAETGAAAGESGAPADRAGTIQIGDSSYPLRVVRCDLSGNSPDGMLLESDGTARRGALRASCPS